MKIEDLRESKIFFNNKSDWERFKDVFVRIGHPCDPYPYYVNAPFALYIDENFDLTIDSGISSTSNFINSEYKQIFISDVVKIKTPKRYIFQAYDRVLVRTGYNRMWRPTIFSYYDKRTEYEPYVDVALKSYRQCIPYEGNEHLAGTHKNIYS